MSYAYLKRVARYKWHGCDGERVLVVAHSLSVEVAALADKVAAQRVDGHRIAWYDLLFHDECKRHEGETVVYAQH